MRASEFKSTAIGVFRWRIAAPGIGADLQARWVFAVFAQSDDKMPLDIRGIMLY
jgi:hypothetical protein